MSRYMDKCGSYASFAAAGFSRHQDIAAAQNQRHRFGLNIRRQPGRKVTERNVASEWRYFLPR